MGGSQGPYTDTNDLHVSVRTISMQYHKIKQVSHERYPRAQTIILICQHPIMDNLYVLTYTQYYFNVCA